MMQAVNIIGYLQHATGSQKVIAISPEDIREISGKGSITTDWLENYPNSMDNIDEVPPQATREAP